MNKVPNLITVKKTWERYFKGIASLRQVYSLLDRRELDSLRIGRKRLVYVDSIERFFARQKQPQKGREKV